MNGEADCPTDLEMAAPKGQGRGPQLLPSLNLIFVTGTHQLRFLWAVSVNWSEVYKVKLLSVLGLAKPRLLSLEFLSYLLSAVLE